MGGGAFDQVPTASEFMLTLRVVVHIPCRFQGNPVFVVITWRLVAPLKASRSKHEMMWNKANTKAHPSELRTSRERLTCRSIPVQRDTNK